MSNILVVCTANQCRSPLAAGRGEDILDPMGKGMDAFVALADTLAIQTEAVADLL